MSKLSVTLGRKKYPGLLSLNIKGLFVSPCHWLLCVPLSTKITSEKWEWLSREEQSRAQRFRQPEDQQRYKLAHILKRHCLAQIMGVPPKHLSFCVGKKNKPYCNNPGSPHFNISHSGDWVLLGVSTLEEIGVDVEAFRDVSEEVKDFILNPQQQLGLSQDSHPKSRFMVYWTQKEAVSKALGLGLSMNVKTINCNGRLGQSRFSHSKDQFYLYSQLLDDNHTMSVASTGADTLHLYQLIDWSEDDWQVRALNL